MSFLDKLERKVGFIAIHNLTLFIVVGQALMFGMFLLRGGDPALVGKMTFTLSQFLSGEVWRIVTFLIIPKVFSFWIIIALLVFQMIGSSLEQHWGAFRYSLYFFIGVLGLLFTSVLFPYYPLGNFYLLTSIFFAFAYLNPNFEFLLFFVLPVKVKWLGWLSFAYLVLAFLGSGIEEKFAIIGSTLNFPLFFAADIVRSFRAKKRVEVMKSEKRKLEAEPFHACVKCGATDISEPDREFRYRKDGAVCSECLAKEGREID